MDIIRNSVWQSHDSDVLSDGLYRVLDFDRDTDLLILFEIKKKERVNQFHSHFHNLHMVWTRKE